MRPATAAKIPHVQPAVFDAVPLEQYALLDSGGGEKLERFAGVVLRRPAPQALWRPRLSPERWVGADLSFVRESDRGGRWEIGPRAPAEVRGEDARWPLEHGGARFLVRPTPFKHVGLFPEQATNWAAVEAVREELALERPRLLNLFGYTGAASVLAARAGWDVTHVDASKASLTWAVDNAEATGLGRSAFRVVHEDALRFAQRAVRREQRYDAIVLDPIESGSLAGPIEQAQAAGIPLVTLDTRIDHPNILSLIGVEQYDTSVQFGRYVAGYIAGKMDGEATIGLMIASSEVQIARRDGFVDAIKSVLPNVTFAAAGDGRNILERATAEAENMLTANPDIDLIYATGDPQLQGALAAGLSQNRDIAFFGWDDIPDYFVAPIKEGRLQGFLMQAPEFNGDQGVRLLVQHLGGEEISPRGSNIPTIVTPFNIDDIQ